MSESHPNRFDSMHANKEYADGQKVACASITLDSSGQQLMNRIANKTYERCRSQKLVLPAFPNFEPHIMALKNEAVAMEQKTYKVTCRNHDRLQILESLARRWLDDETTCEDARAVVQAHNDEFNMGNDDLMMDRRGLHRQI